MGLHTACVRACVRALFLLPRSRPLYQGNIVRQLRSDDGKYTGACVSEPFLDLSLVVRGNAGVEDALKEAVHSESLKGENQWEVETG